MEPIKHRPVTPPLSQQHMRETSDGTKGLAKDLFPKISEKLGQEGVIHKASLGPIGKQVDSRPK